MGVEWAEISYLKGQERVCNVYICVCVYILSGVSVYSGGDLDKSGQTHTKEHEVSADGRRCVF